MIIIILNKIELDDGSKPSSSPALLHQIPTSIFKVINLGGLIRPIRKAYS